MAARALPAIGGINFGDLGFYVAGGGVPPGKYALEFNVQMYQATNQQGATRGPIRLGVMVKHHSLSDAEHRGDKALTQFYSMGSSADKSFAPNPTGKGILPIPGGPAQTLNNSTNWALFLKSMYDCGLPPNVFTNDLSVLDGVHVQTSQVDEPKERATMQSQTAEGSAPEDRKPQKISVICEILDDGKPWEGKGGVPAAGAPVAVAAAPRAMAPVAVAAPAGVAASGAVDDDTIMTAAITGIADVLEKKPQGCPKLILRTTAFTAIKANPAYGDVVAQAVQTNIFNNEAAFGDLLAQVGYKIAGVDVKPM